MDHDRLADRGMKLDHLLVQAARFGIARRWWLVTHQLGVARRQEFGQCRVDVFLGRRRPIGPLTIDELRKYSANLSNSREQSASGGGRARIDPRRATVGSCGSREGI